jgi:hypothetical protein
VVACGRVEHKEEPMDLREAEARILGILEQFEKDNPSKCVIDVKFERLDISTFDKRQMLPQIYIYYTDSSENLWGGEDPRGIIKAVKPIGH